jgi:hypothetical protein
VSGKTRPIAPGNQAELALNVWESVANSDFILRVWEPNEKSGDAEAPPPFKTAGLTARQPSSGTMMIVRSPLTMRRDEP